MMKNTWQLPNQVDWNNVFERGAAVIVYGVRKNLMDDFFKMPTADYACGHIATLSEDSITIESLIQGDVDMLMSKIDKVMVLDD